MVENILIRGAYFRKYWNFGRVYEKALYYSFDNMFSNPMCQNTNIMVFPNRVNIATILIWINWLIV